MNSYKKDYSKDQQSQPGIYPEQEKINRQKSLPTSKG